MPQTTQMQFKTRYGLTLIDNQTQQPMGETQWTDNILLRSGALALGNEVAYQSVSVGISNSPTNVEQQNLLNPVAEFTLSNADFTQTIFEQDSNVISRIEREVVFKSFRFPSNERTLTIHEIGVTGVTRALVSDPIVINNNNWLKVVVQIDYVYSASPSRTVIKKINNTPSTEVLTYDVTPFIYNQTPTNTAGRGYGVTNALYGYVWDGTENGLSNRNYGQTLGLTVSATLDYVACCYRFVVTGSFPVSKTIPGFIIRDTINGGAYKITFPDGWVIEEDDSIQIEFVYSWAITSTLTTSI